LDKKFVFVASIVILSTLLPQLATQLKHTGVDSFENMTLYNITGQGESLPKCKVMNVSYLINGSTTLDWAVWPEPCICFENVSEAFVINANNVVFDLTGHMVMFGKPLGEAPGPTGVLVDGKTQVTIRNGAIQDFQNGIWIKDSSNVIVGYCNVSAATWSIWIRNSRDVTIVSNIVSGAADVNIGIERNSTRVTLLNNTVSESTKEAIYLRDSGYNVISDNTISNNGYGVLMYDVTKSDITGNMISNNSQGIYMEMTSQNNISSNTLLNNPKGMEIRSSTDNIIHHNNFINNAKQVESMESKNTWNLDYPRGGNYWSNYAGKDEFSGANWTVPGSDGMGDKPFILTENNQDTYPLMNPVNVMLRVFDITGERNITDSVAVFSNSSITDFNFDKTLIQISFKVSNGTFCRVIIPKEVLSGAFKVLIDNINIGSMLNWDDTHIFIDFTYSEELTQNVIIKGETVAKIPLTEFPDVNGDGKIDITDLFLVAKHYGEER